MAMNCIYRTTPRNEAASTPRKPLVSITPRGYFTST
jgi:hypothetical protein